MKHRDDISYQEPGVLDRVQHNIAIPTEGAQVRAYLIAREHDHLGRWRRLSYTWFEARRQFEWW